MTPDVPTPAGGPRLVTTRDGLREALADVPAGPGAHAVGSAGGGSGRRAVVMTMGALHAGHLALVRAAREVADHVVVTIFVNPLQFAPGEDLDRYPRDLDGDLALLAGAGADVVFAPTPDVVYPDGDPVVRVAAGAVGDVLEGAARPGHLDGVLTVVLKLLHLVRPDVALFGQKDAQQLMAVRRMVRDLDVDVEVVGVPTVRDADGLALSSRNAYLSADERRRALVLSRAVRAAEEAAVAGGGAADVRAAAQAVLAGGEVDVEYAALVDPLTAQDVPADHLGAAVLALAARVGSTRLIDNAPLMLGRHDLEHA
ncbi:pantoate--beta-alanine ligase [Cellulomonas aerilata]|uniref:Pantothenate synthetase n=1 Tax=Cellulomonas aerilata TaxID=515326 RepID=A0A512DEI1_9CELL|nr:pantoate--beta-alanine ligase [Cellulomonas aerilata]GEO34884.1 pantothenate synthetase [Cellulomonas aerilata]